MALLQQFEREGNWLFRHRGSLPFLLLLAALAVYLLTSAPAGTGYEWACLTIGLFGLAVRVCAVGYAPAETSGRNTSEGQIAARVNTSGIYSVMRHPLYFGNFLMWLSAALLTRNAWFIVVFCLVFWLYYERIMYAEEAFLRRKFGPPYDDWASRTPAFIPNFHRFVKPDLPFSWKKALKQEKNGLMFLLAVFCLFDVAGQLAAGTRDFNFPLMIVGGAGLVFYLILKYLKSKTGLLDERGR